MLKITVLIATISFGVMHADVLTDYLALKRQHDTIETEQKRLYTKKKYNTTVRSLPALVPEEALAMLPSKMLQTTTADWFSFENSIKDINSIIYLENPQADAQAADAIAAFIALKNRHIDEEKINEHTYTSHLQHIEEQRIRQKCENDVNIEKRTQKLSFVILLASSLALANAPFTNEPVPYLNQGCYITAAAVNLWIVCKTAEHIEKIRIECEKKIVSSPLYEQLNQLTEKESL